MAKKNQEKSLEERGRDVWDFQMEQSNKTNKMWKYLALLMSAGFILSVLFGYSAAVQPAMVPYVVTVDSQSGEVTFRGVMQAQPMMADDAVVQFYISRFVRGLRVVTSDPVVLRRNYSEIYSLASRSAQSQITEIMQSWTRMTAEEGSGFAMSELGMRRDVRFHLFERISSETWRAEWTEDIREEGILTNSIRMSGTFSFTLSLPESIEEARVNPFGLYFTEFFITRRG